jgi:hypothetical protein
MCEPEAGCQSVVARSDAFASNVHRLVARDHFFSTRSDELVSGYHTMVAGYQTVVTGYQTVVSGYQTLVINYQFSLARSGT